MLLVSNYDTAPFHVSRGGIILAVGPLLCRVGIIHNRKAKCGVINGYWDIGFDLDTGQVVEYLTDVRALPYAYGSKILLAGDFLLSSGRLYDNPGYNEDIAYFLKCLTGDAYLVSSAKFLEEKEFRRQEREDCDDIPF